jgi:hypothetical protein
MYARMGLEYLPGFGDEFLHFTDMAGARSQKDAPV